MDGAGFIDLRAGGAYGMFSGAAACASGRVDLRRGGYCGSDFCDGIVVVTSVGAVVV